MPACREISRTGKCIADFIMDLHSNEGGTVYGRRKTAVKDGRMYISVIGNESGGERNFRVIV